MKRLRHQYSFLGIKYGLKSITVSLPGQKPQTYTKSDYTINSESRAYIDDSVLNRDFSTTGVYGALIAGYSLKGTSGAAAREWMAGIDSSFNATANNYCMTFVSWALNQAGVDSPNAHYAGKAIDWYSGRGKYDLIADGHTPNVGDTIFMGTYTEPGGHQVQGGYHAAIVIAFVPPDTVYTIEGGGAGTDVKVAKRSLSDMRDNSRIYGIGRNGGTGNGYVPLDSDIKVP